MQLHSFDEFRAILLANPMPSLELPEARSQTNIDQVVCLRVGQMERLRTYRPSITHRNFETGPVPAVGQVHSYTEPHDAHFSIIFFASFGNQHIMWYVSFASVQFFPSVRLKLCSDAHTLYTSIIQIRFVRKRLIVLGRIVWSRFGYHSTTYAMHNIQSRKLLKTALWDVCVCVRAQWTCDVDAFLFLSDWSYHHSPPLPLCTLSIWGLSLFLYTHNVWHICSIHTRIRFGVHRFALAVKTIYTTSGCCAFPLLLL